MDIEEKKKQLYRKELISTVLIALLFFVMCYTVFIFVLFPGLKGPYLLGFPIHYAITLIFGWFGMIVATLIYVKVGTKFDEEMEEFAAEYSEMESNDSFEEGEG